MVGWRKWLRDIPGNRYFNLDGFVSVPALYIAYQVCMRNITFDVERMKESNKLSDRVVAEIVQEAKTSIKLNIDPYENFPLLMIYTPLNKKWFTYEAGGGEEVLFYRGLQFLGSCPDNGGYYYSEFDRCVNAFIWDDVDDEIEFNQGMLNMFGESLHFSLESLHPILS